MITDADLIPVFSLDGLAIEATLFDSSSSRVINAFYSEGTDRVEMYDIAVEAVEPNIIVRTADISGVVRGWGVVVAARNYTVVRIQHIGTGVSVLYLKRSAGD